jgi:hypothetical protein
MTQKPAVLNVRLGGVSLPYKTTPLFTAQIDSVIMCLESLN